MRANWQVVVIISSMNGLIDELKRSDRRSISIVVGTDGKVIVRAPRKTPAGVIDLFVSSKQEWIESTKVKMLARKPRPQEKDILKDGLLLLGEPIRVTVTDEKSVHYDNINRILYLPNRPLPQISIILEKFYKSQARVYLSGRLNQLAAKTGYQVEKFRLSSARTRWGSCSGKGTISLNWKLLLAPKAVVDYVIIHELCHLDHMNHSPAFWKRVGTHLPDYQRHRDWLKKNGNTLTLEGIKI
ncbi:MAG TPA: SprT family zinc-dependent metalloprotease [Anaerolineales bacterium]|nr:SprT family zinc-dependent metalloprotease [Anaerolineales bacterium]